MTMAPLKHTKNSFRTQHGNVSCFGCSFQSNGTFVHPSRVLLAPPAASGSPSSPTAITRSTSPMPNASVPSIPETVNRTITASRRSWFNRCLNAPLIDPATNSRVHVYGNVHFAPIGGADGIAELQELVDRIQPTILAIEQPYDIGARAGLPYPEIIHHLTTLFPEEVPNFSGYGSSQQPTSGTAAAASPAAAVAAVAAVAGGGASMDAGARVRTEEQLGAVLPGLIQPARIGRDLLDPFEVFGMYGGSDYVTRPDQLMEALRLFGHLPGLEYAALVVAAQQKGVQVCSVDAPLRLQEKWVSKLVADFTLAEADLTRRLQHDLDRAQGLLPPEYLQWDVDLAEALRQAERRRAESKRGAGASGGPAGAVRGAGGNGDGSKGAGQPSLSTVTAFKVSRAVAAATVPYEAAQEAFTLQAALQPLKFALFAQRAKHLVLQVRDLCQRMSMRHVRVDASNFKAPAGTGNGQGIQAGADGSSMTAGMKRRAAAAAAAAACGEDVALVDISEQPEKVVLAVVGRQYMPYIEELWSNERSFLWHGDVSRTFARSTLDRRC